VSLSGCAGCTTVGPGYAGIKVNMYGTDKGVSGFPLVTGIQFYNPITTRILEYPTFIQTAIWTKDANEGSPKNEELTFNTKEGMSVSTDISLSYSLVPDKVPSFYVKFRSDDLNTFTHGFLRNTARDAFNEVAVGYLADEINGPKKEEFLTAVRARVNKNVEDYGVKIEQFGVIGNLRLPEAVMTAINGKIKAIQDAIRVENEVRQATAEANKTVATAEGAAKARIAEAEGTAKSNTLINESLNDKLIEWKRLELQGQALNRWDGKMPQYNGGGALPFIQVK
jgi:regulator of protease activity HflC (stomatin/prohibitin superfamily)